MPKPPAINTSTQVVEVTGNTRGLTEMQKIGHLPKNLRPKEGAIALGKESLTMDIDEYCFRQFNNGGSYALLYGFGKYVLDLLIQAAADDEAGIVEYPCPDLKRSKWDKLFDQYSDADGAIGNIVIGDLLSKKERSRLTDAATEPDEDSKPDEE